MYILPIIKPSVLLRSVLLGVLTVGMPALSGGVLTERESILREIPPWVTLQKIQETLVIHAEQGDAQAAVHLAEGVLQLETETAFYASDRTWVVADCMVFDVDHDGFDEVLLHVWKPGSFGEYQPFWRELEDRTVYSEHLFLYEWDRNREDGLDPKWMSSAMPVQGMEVCEEAKGRIRITAPDGSETLWSWEGWGLVLQ